MHAPPKLLPQKSGHLIDVRSGIGYAVNSKNGTEYLPPGVLLFGRYTQTKIEETLKNAKLALRNMRPTERFDPEKIELQYIPSLLECVKGCIGFNPQDVNQIFRVKGHFARWTLDGYLDCGEWHHDTVRSELIKRVKREISPED